MRQKGFTLIELVGVIVLVSLMVLIIVPTVEKSVKVGQVKADKQLKDNMILAAKSWAVDNKGKMPQEPGVKINIWLSDLQKDGYIERDIKLPSTGASIDEACIEATNKSSNVAKKDVYDYVYNDNCTINLDLVIIGKIGNTPITSGTWTNKDITLTATSSYTGTYQWYSGSTAINGATKKSYVATKGTNTEGKVTYKVKMKSEKRTPEATYVAAIDKKAPAISITSKIATKDNLTISLSETSSGSGLKGYAITSSATTPTTWTAISGTSYSNTFSKATGTYYIHVKDVAGNTTYKTVSITSMDPPTCSISLSGTIGTNSWYKTNVGVTLNGSGTVSTKGLATTQNSTNGVGSVTHSTDTSGVTYYGYVSNVAGSNSCSKTFKMDKTIPSISTVTKIATKNNLTISLADSMSGLSGYNVTTSTAVPSTWTSISGKSYSTTLTKSTGTYYVHVKDLAGNTTYKTVSITSMDPPTCSISLSGTIGTNSWYKTNVGVTLNGSGTVSTKGLATTQNSTNGVGSVTHSTDTSGVTYYGYVSNVAGSNSCSKTFKMDKTIPSVSTVTKVSTSNNLTITLADSMSGLSGYSVTTSTAVPSTWTSVSGKSYSTTLTKSTGTYYVHVKDLAGNTTYKSVSVKTMNPPTCSIGLSGTVGNNGWYRSNVSVSMTTSGTVSAKGLATSANSTNGSTYITHSSDTKGITYYGYVSNEAGSGSCTATFKRDVTAPSISTSNTGGSNWTNKNVTITASVSDPTSGVAKTGYSYSSNGSGAIYNDWTTGTATTSATGIWSAERDNTVYITSTDNAGNTTVKSAGQVRIDKTAPVCGGGTCSETGQCGIEAGAMNKGGKCGAYYWIYFRDNLSGYGSSQSRHCYIKVDGKPASSSWGRVCGTRNDLPNFDWTSGVTTYSTPTAPWQLWLHHGLNATYAQAVYQFKITDKAGNTATCGSHQQTYNYSWLPNC